MLKGAKVNQWQRMFLVRWLIILILSAGLLGLLFLGCSATHGYCHPKRSVSQIERDYAQCSYEAEKATAGSGSGTGNAVKAGFNHAIIESKCMKLRGYGTLPPWPLAQDKCIGHK